MIKNYHAAIEYLYTRLPMFTRDGAKAIKVDIANTVRFCQALGDPQMQFKAIHVAGTNGKGSTSHMLAAILGAAGYKTGLYTSPHLVDFRERIRIDGVMIPEERVLDFVQREQAVMEAIQPSFFEATVAMAFDYFAAEKVDIALIEVGLGGRLDSTNIIHPELCVITNIGMDHMDMLGSTLPEIAAEKAGIIKAGVPVVVSERDERIAEVFETKAQGMQAPLRFASDAWRVQQVERQNQGLLVQVADQLSHEVKAWYVGLAGYYQQKNLLGVLTAVDALREQGWQISEEQLRDGLANVMAYTGLQGRWQTLSTDPWVICDTGHNADGIREVVENIDSLDYARLHMVIGAMRDKDLNGVLTQLPKDAYYYFGSPDMPRAMPAEELAEKAAAYGLVGSAYASVAVALAAARGAYQPADLIFVGGSTFVVAEVMAK